MRRIKFNKKRRVQNCCHLLPPWDVGAAGCHLPLSPQALPGKSQLPSLSFMRMTLRVRGHLFQASAPPAGLWRAAESPHHLCSVLGERFHPKASKSCLNYSGNTA